MRTGLFAVFVLLLIQFVGQAQVELGVARSFPTENVDAKDSISVQLLDLDILQAEYEVQQTDVWHRLIPRLSFSASFGLSDILHDELQNGQPVILPRDSYRLSISLPLSEILDSRANEAAATKLLKLKLEREALLHKIAEESIGREHTHQQLIEELKNLADQLQIHDRLLEYRELEFEQGKADYTDVARSKLDLLNLRRSISRVRAQLGVVGP